MGPHYPIWTLWRHILNRPLWFEAGNRHLDQTQNRLTLPGDKPKQAGATAQTPDNTAPSHRGV